MVLIGFLTLWAHVHILQLSKMKLWQLQQFIWDLHCPKDYGFSNITLCPSKEIHLLKCGRVGTHKKRVTHVYQVQQAHFPFFPTAPRITTQHTKVGHKYGQCKWGLLCYYLRRTAWCSLSGLPKGSAKGPQITIFIFEAPMVLCHNTHTNWV